MQGNTLMTIERTCVGCRKSVSTDQLVRVVVRENRIVVDPDRSAPGRGAYVHRNQACIAQAVTRKAVTRALRVSADVDVSALRDLQI
jgi:predicted RNA-binding protein YlxR (DUF448 family)